MRKLSCILIAFLGIISCRNNAGDADQGNTEELVFNYQKMPKKLTIIPEAAQIVEDWEEFKNLTISFEVLYKARNNEDLILAIDDLIEKEKLLAKSTYPELFDDFQVKSRQRVLKTYLLKVKASILNNQDTTDPTVEMLEAYNAFRKQLNVVVNSQLDTKLILDEN